MEIRNIASTVQVEQSAAGRLRISIPLTRFYNGTAATEQRLMLGVVERFSPGCFGEVDYIDDDCRISADEDGLTMSVEIDASSLLRMAGRPVRSSIAFRPIVVEWEGGDDVDIRWIRQAELIEVGPADDETEPTWLDIWRQQRANGCESMVLQHGIKTLTTTYRWSPASEAAIRETYNAEAV